MSSNKTDSILLYGDLIDLPRPVSAKHEPMSRKNRAAQFAPYAALTGYGDLIRESARTTADREEVVEDLQNMLDAVLSLLLSSGGSPSVTVTCFFPDDRKEGGEYRTCHGRLSGFDEYTRTLLFEDGTSLSVENIIDLDSPVLSQNGDLSL